MPERRCVPGTNIVLPDFTVCRRCGCSLGEDASDWECPGAPEEDLDAEHDWVTEQAKEKP